MGIAAFLLLVASDCLIIYKLGFLSTGIRASNETDAGLYQTRFENRRKFNDTTQAFLSYMENLPVALLLVEPLCLAGVVAWVFTIGPPCFFIHSLFQSLCCPKDVDQKTYNREYWTDHVGGVFRFGASGLCLLVVPFSNTVLLLLGSWWDAVVVLRIVCQCMSFASAAVAGMSVNIFASGPKCAIFANSSDLVIESVIQLLSIILLRLTPICISLYASSMAWITFLSLIIHYDLRTDVAQGYAVLTIIKTVVSLSKIILGAIFVRLDLSKDGGMTCVDYIRHTDVHTHVIFVVDILVYGALIVMNGYIVNLHSD